MPGTPDSTVGIHFEDSGDGQMVGEDNPLPVQMADGDTATVQGELIDRSSEIAVGGSSQVLAPTNPSRRILFVQNLSGEALWIDFGTNAVESRPSVEIPVGSSFTMGGDGFIDTRAVNIIGPTTGQDFTAKEGPSA